MTKERIDEIIGVTPPSTVDVEAVVARERKTAWLRPNPWTVTAAGVAAVAVGAAFMFAPGSSGTVSPAAPPSSAPELPEPCKIPVLQGPAPPEKPAVAAERLTGVLTAAVKARMVAGTTLAPHGASYPVGDPEHGPLEFVHEDSLLKNSGSTCSGGRNIFAAGATTVLAGKTGNVQVSLGRLGGRTLLPAECEDQTIAGAEETCTRSVGPKGEVIVASIITFTGGGPVINQVAVTRADKIGVVLQAENTADAKRSRKPDSPAPPLTLEQLTEIALDPGMTLYP
ncbi:hypothetical protein [Amycolatopsis sp. NPDC051071]|uniref:hypothetical protein n=1 Tax=Amycolatopsis sp. NPDC051071 TaxID=3154637 RepID=UPI00344A971F